MQASPVRLPSPVRVNRNPSVAMRSGSVAYLATVIMSASALRANGDESHACATSRIIAGNYPVYSDLLQGNASRARACQTNLM